MPDDSSSDSSYSSTSWDNEVDGPPRNGRPRRSFSGTSAESIYGSFSHQRTEERPLSPSQQPAEAEPADKERQILLLMLLAQVCALHDPTPRTFTVHVLELFERGILDRDSIRFLFDLGLVPKRPAVEYTNAEAHASATAMATVDVEQPGCPQHVPSRDAADELALVVAPPAQRQLRTARRGPPQRMQSLDAGQFLRTQEASEIRTQLAQDESRPKAQRSASSPSFQRTASEPSSWQAEHHPLSLSRYQREFHQAQLISSGAFGHVYRAVNKMDGREYAIKRVAFSATGYSNDSVAQVVREIRCLALCDHPNCVRYYTSWLEPSWMTGSTGASTIDAQHTQQRLLTDIQQMVLVGGGVPDSIASPPSNKPPSRRFSFDDTCRDPFDMAADADEYDEWTVESGGTKDDSSVGRGGSSWCRHKGFKGTEEQRKPSYRYQICMFIQMQLCHPSTLADWIRQLDPSASVSSRAATAVSIFSQLVRGLEHIHAKGIIHRDLKPANIFAGEDGQFKIGDFGLSKLLRSANRGRDFFKGVDSSNVTPMRPLLRSGETPGEDSSWNDPLTAGIGTASYAAPEQVASRAYGPEADIFSLGLILLELVCNFSTEHERILVFRDCRAGSVPNSLSEDCPQVAMIVLSCTQSNPKKRPTARDLCTSHVVVEQHILREQLKEKEKVIAEKDQLIQNLRRQVESLSALQLQSEVESDGSGES